MFGWLKRSPKQPPSEESGFILGYAFSFTNETLGLDYEGLGFEIVAQMRDDGQDPSFIANHMDTAIAVSEVLQEQPVLEFSGGPHAEAVMELLDALVDGDHDSAQRVLDGDPAILSGEHDGAGIPLLAEVFAGRVDNVRFLLAQGADVNRVGHRNMSPLHWSSARGDVGTNRELLDAGASVSALNLLYATPRDLAGLNGHKELAPDLVAADIGAPKSSHIETVLAKMGCTVD